MNKISPLDDRYRSRCEDLAIFSEKEVFKKRLKIEAEYLIFLAENIGNPSLTREEKKIIRGIYQNYDEKDFKGIKKIEKTIKHDIKSVEEFLKSKMKDNGVNSKTNMIHFGLTSEDINNLVYSILLKKAKKTLLKEVEKLRNQLKRLAKDHKNLPMLSRTHGQPASPTTLGKEFTNYLDRIEDHHKILKDYKFPGKISGATGNYNAFEVSYPDVDWVELSQDFVRRFELEPSVFNTQIVPHDKISRFLREIKSLNLVMIDLNTDLWDYISRDYFLLKTNEEEVGSSTMPHKVNPIDFESSEGNLKIANTILTELADDLQVSRLQRDLSDSTMKRNYGVGLSHSLLGYKKCHTGLTKLRPNKKEIRGDLKDQPQVLTEAIQTILRREGDKKAYQKVKEFSRGKKRNLEELKAFIEDLEVDQEIKEELISLETENYTGLASQLTEKYLNSK